MAGLAYLNGEFVAADEAVIPVDDAGFVLGVTVSEQLRSFAGKLFRVDEHLARLRRSLDIVGVDPGLQLADLAAAANKLAHHNHALLAAGDDLGLAILITPGTYAAFSGGRPARPTVCLHTYPLPFRLWAEKYEAGQSLMTTDVRQVPSACWPAELKCRSRMHYYLADRQARAMDSQARAVLLDIDGFVSETSSANIVMVSGEGLVSPPQADILPGISLAVVRELAAKLKIPHSERKLTPDDLSAADELLLTSTPNCLLPATRFNGRPIGSAGPGPVYRRLLAAWNQLAGLDIATQARQFKDR